ncbi:MAG TPA: hypothetical protein VFU48_13320 [Nitrospira sp.]|nr:hypothetical protein [Nitrospira sp.]
MKYFFRAPKIYVGEAPRLYTRTMTVSNVTSSTVNSLTVGRMYYFAVTAYNSAGENPPSNEVSKTIQLLTEHTCFLIQMWGHI